MSVSKGRNFSYEAMILLSQSVAADLGGAIEHIRQILGRAGARLIAMRKWDERRLAFEIDKNKRGTYLLAYFAVDPVKLAQIERDFALSETVLRSMIIRADHLTEEEMQAADAQRELETEVQLRRARADAPPAGAGTAAPASSPMPVGAGSEAQGA